MIRQMQLAAAAYAHPHFRRMRGGASREERNSGRSKMGVHHAGKNHDLDFVSRSCRNTAARGHVIDGGANLSLKTPQAVRSTRFTRIADE